LSRKELPQIAPVRADDGAYCAVRPPVHDLHREDSDLTIPARLRMMATKAGMNRLPVLKLA
jgi:hypothetical protein